MVQRTTYRVYLISEEREESEEQLQVTVEAISMAQSTTLLVEKLTSTRYSVWALRMEHVQNREALWEYVDSPPAAPTTVYDDVKDEKTLAAIILSVTDDQLIHVHGKVNAKQAWHSLEEVYVQCTAGLLTALNHKMYHMVMWPGDSVRGHLSVLAEAHPALGAKRQDSVRGRPKSILFSVPCWSSIIC